MGQGTAQAGHRNRGSPSGTRRDWAIGRKTRPTGQVALSFRIIQIERVHNVPSDAVTKGELRKGYAVITETKDNAQPT